MDISVNFNPGVSTLLCYIMQKYGSDKGSPNMNGHHNYTTYYDALFSSSRMSIKNVFELGLGTNNLDVPSNMGVNGKPGASHYGWREYFPNAQIYGADIDSRILFNSDRIKTFYCDQTKPDVISNMWEQVPETFDIIIEDGYHSFDANKCFFENSYHKLAVGGVYIIEDVYISNLAVYEKQVDIWRKELPAFDFKIILIPHSNIYDNCLIVIKRNA